MMNTPHLETTNLTAMQELKAATKGSHDQLEEIAQSKRILSPDMSLDEFKGLMKGHYQLHQLLEAPLTVILDRELATFNYGQERQKLRLLEQDLLDLGLSAEACQSHLACFAFNSLPEALGIAYVLEGSTLGGNVIRKALQRHTDLPQSCQFHYYDCYGDQLGQRWLEFSRIVNQHLTDSHDIQSACQAAIETFKLAANIFSECVIKQESSVGSAR